MTERAVLAAKRGDWPVLIDEMLDAAGRNALACDDTAKGEAKQRPHIDTMQMGRAALLAALTKD